jgi:uncharacterized delta-60 repeat protein
VGTSVVIQSDGKIVVGGNTFSFNTGTDFALARYNADGSLDASFGAGGKVITDVAVNGNDFLAGLALQSDGKIIAAGSSIPLGPDGSNFAVVRYDTNGVLDPTFGTGGIASIDFGSAREIGRAVALQLDGKIVVGGETTTDFRPQFALARYNVDGTADATFGTGGFSTTSFSPDMNTQIFGIGIQADDRIVAAGTTFVQNVPGNGDFGVARYNADGSLDTTFGTNGLTITDFSVSSDAVTGMTIQLDGKIIVVGSTTFGSAIGAADFAIARYEGPPPHTVTFFLHGHDVPGTAGGFTMNQTAPSSQMLLVEIGQSPRWFSDPAVNGTFLTGATFRLVLPCAIGVSLPKTVTLASTDLNGGNAQVLGHATQGLVICFGQPTVSLAIPVSTPARLTNRRLKLTVSGLGQATVLPLGAQTFLEATSLVGAP